MNRTNQNPIDEPRWLKFLLIAFAAAFLGLMLVIPLISIFVEAFRQGWDLYIASLTEPDAVSAIKLTLQTAAIVLPINVPWLAVDNDLVGFTIFSFARGCRFNVYLVVR